MIVSNTTWSRLTSGYVEKYVALTVALHRIASMHALSCLILPRRQDPMILGWVLSYDVYEHRISDIESEGSQ